MSKMFPRGFGFGLPADYLKKGIDAVNAELAANPQLAEDAWLAAEERMAEGPKPWPPQKPVETAVAASSTPSRTEHVVSDACLYIDLSELPECLRHDRPRSNIR